jgi:modulator of FtsH protease
MESVAAEWSDLFVAAAGASAALAGLVFVAVSINVDRIVGAKGLPELALMTLLLLVGVLVVSLFGLIPDQGSNALGLELLVQSVLWTIAVLSCAYLSVGSRTANYQYVSRLAFPLLGTVPYVIGAVILLSGEASGLNWVFAGMIGAIVAAVMNAWILLVEILR